MTKGIISFAKA